MQIFDLHFYSDWLWPYCEMIVTLRIVTSYYVLAGGGVQRLLLPQSSQLAAGSRRPATGGGSRVPPPRQEMRLPLQSGDSDMLVSATKAACRFYHVATVPLARASAMWCRRALLRCFCGKAAVCVRIIEYICPSIMFGTSLGSRHNESPLSLTPCGRLQKALG